MHLVHILIIALAFASEAFAQTPRMTEVFQVNVQPFADSKSTCVRNINGRPLFEPNAAAFSGSNGILNIIWDQLHMIYQNANDAVSIQGYNNPGHYRTRQLLFSFFGIQPKEQPNFHTEAAFEHSLEDDDEHGARTSYRKLQSVRWNFKDAWKIINRRQHDGENKIKLMCDGTFMVFQTAQDEVKDANGDPIPKGPDDPGEGKWKLKEWEISKGRNFETLWYFWYEIAGEKGYIVLDRNGYPAIPGTNPPAPWSNDPRTNKPNPCIGGQHGNLGSTIIGMPKHCWEGGGSDFSDCGGSEFGDGGEDSPPPDDDQSAPWSEGSWIILCEASFSKGLLQPPPHAPPDGASLDSLDLTSNTISHEIYHLTERENDDANKRLLIPGMTDLTIKSEYNIMQGVPTNGATECMFLARREMAGPFTESYKAVSTRNPESYAWAAAAFWLQAIWDRDFSSGACEQ